MRWEGAAINISSIPLPHDYRAELADQRAQERDSREKHHENDRDIEDQFFNSTTRFEGRARAWSAEGATQTGSAYLEQNKQNNGYAQDNLNNANRRKPL